MWSWEFCEWECLSRNSVNANVGCRNSECQYRNSVNENVWCRKNMNENVWCRHSEKSAYYSIFCILWLQNWFLRNSQQEDAAQARTLSPFHYVPESGLSLSLSLSLSSPPCSSSPSLSLPSSLSLSSSSFSLLYPLFTLLLPLFSLLLSNFSLHLSLPALSLSLCLPEINLPRSRARSHARKFSIGAYGVSARAKSQSLSDTKNCGRAKNCVAQSQRVALYWRVWVCVCARKLTESHSLWVAKSCGRAQNCVCACKVRASHSLIFSLPSPLSSLHLSHLSLLSPSFFLFPLSISLFFPPSISLTSLFLSPSVPYHRLSLSPWVHAGLCLHAQSHRVSRSVSCKKLWARTELCLCACGLVSVRAKSESWRVSALESWRVRESERQSVRESEN